MIEFRPRLKSPWTKRESGDPGFRAAVWPTTCSKEVGLSLSGSGVTTSGFYAL